MALAPFFERLPLGQASWREEAGLSVTGHPRSRNPNESFVSAKVSVSVTDMSQLWHEGYVRIVSIL